MSMVANLLDKGTSSVAPDITKESGGIVHATVDIPRLLVCYRRLSNTADMLQAWLDMMDVL